MRQRNATLDFVEACRALTSADEIAQLLFAEMERCGVLYVACASHVDPLKPPAGAVAMVNYPSPWLVRFSERRYAGRDPIFWGARWSGREFWWDEFIAQHALAKDQKRILLEAAECGLKGGLTIPIHSPGALPASCSLVPGSDGVDPLIVPDLHFMALHAHEQARLRAGGDRRVPVQLTKRQHECLALAAQGKSDYSIGQILGISPRTACHTIENARQRYGVANRVQAIVLALFDGQLSTSDVAD